MKRQPFILIGFSFFLFSCSSVTRSNDVPEIANRDLVARSSEFTCSSANFARVCFSMRELQSLLDLHRANVQQLYDAFTLQRLETIDLRVHFLTPRKATEVQNDCLAETEDQFRDICMDSIAYVFDDLWKHLQERSSYRNSVQMYNSYDYVELVDRSFLVRNRGGIGDVGYFRQYVTAMGENLILLSIHIVHEREAAFTNSLIEQITIEEI